MEVKNTSILLGKKMDSWKNWYQNFLFDKQNKEMQAFLNGLNGKPLENSKIEKYSENSNWLDFLNYALTNEIENGYEFKNKIIFKNDILNYAILKCVKNLSYIYPYSEDFIHMVLYKNLNLNSNPIDIVKILREPPYEWFTTCPNCEFENIDGWETCKNCGESFEDTLID